jgi:hypothetical protein
MDSMIRVEWGKVEGEDVVAEVVVGVSITATTEMPIIRWALLHQVTVNIQLLCQSHLQAPACLMAHEDLQWAEGSHKILLAMPLSGIVYAGGILLLCCSCVSCEPILWSFFSGSKPLAVEMLRGALAHFDLRFRKEIYIYIYGWYYGTCVYINESRTFGTCLVTWSSWTRKSYFCPTWGGPQPPSKRAGLRKYLTIQLFTTKPTQKSELQHP